VNINQTLIWEMVSFAVFVWFCVKFVWPPLITAMKEREAKIAQGLDAATKAEKALEQAQQNADSSKQEAKDEAAAIIEAANKRAAQIVNDAKEEALSEAARVKATATAEIEQETNSAREALRANVAALTLAGAEKILQKEVDPSTHSDLLDTLAAEL
jgi:F-type H+-transporting ATPase subunit b